MESNPMDGPTPATIDNVIGDNLAAEMTEVAARIRGRKTKQVIDSGRDLIAIKEKLREIVGHGHFEAWVTDTCDMTNRTAENYMRAARWVDSKPENVSLMDLLPLSVIYALAADGVPPDVEDAIIADFVASKEPTAEKPTAEKVARRIALAKKEDKEADDLADNFLSDLLDVETTRRQRRRTMVRVLAGLSAEDCAAIIAEVSAIEPTAEEATQESEPAEQPEAVAEVEAALT